MLKISDLSASYNGITAIQGIDLEVPAGSIVALLGPNGAGKSTLLKVVIGLVKPRTGAITFEGGSLVLPTHEIVKRGVALVPERRQIFPAMTVMENLELGGVATLSKSELHKAIAEMFQQFPMLGERKSQLAGTLSGGQQQMLAIARALMSRPKLLMMDEPSQGLAPIIVRELFQLARRIREQGKTVLLVEQNARMALEIADHLYVLRQGRVVASGAPQEFKADERLITAYLGGRGDGNARRD